MVVKSTKLVQKANPAVRGCQNPAARTSPKQFLCNYSLLKGTSLSFTGRLFLCYGGSENTLQFFQVSDGICGFKRCDRINMVHKYRVHSGIDGALYIGLGVVADHNAFVQ